jgi:hypothetical protein
MDNNDVDKLLRKLSDWRKAAIGTTDGTDDTDKKGQQR